MNVFTPSRYDERITHLALGVEPRAASSGQRLTSGVDVRLESFPKPVDAWRRWPLGQTLTEVLPRLDRHNSGRFCRTYDQGVPTTVTVRIVSDRVRGTVRDAGAGRMIVPRRLRIALATEAAVAAADANPALAPHPLWARAFPFACFPGAAAALPGGATVLRGRVVRDDGTGWLVPVPWARVRARLPGGGPVLGWAHGDDRGEFVLVVEPSGGGVVIPASPVSVDLTVGAVLPPTAPDPADPKLAEVDPLWNLPVETVTATPFVDTNTTIAGREFLAVHTVCAPLTPANPIDLPIGRETTAELQVA